MSQLKGGEFLLRAAKMEDVFSPEDFTDEHRAIARATEEFWDNEVAPQLEEIQHQNHDAAVRVLRKSAELGLTGVVVPEQWGGMEMDMISAMIVAEVLGRDGSYAAWHGAHAGIGTLPLALFGTEVLKKKYLKRLVSAEFVGAYALTEPHAGSDALAAKTRADLAPDGAHYVMNGSKMWITNAGKADIFTVFAKVNGEQDKFTAFIVERAWPGVKVGAEEKKMGIKGSSTCAVYFDNVKVPVENVLGEVGRGHVIAFNILNVGRLKLGPFAVGGSKQVLAQSIKYAKERQAFGGPIARFGMIRHKLAEMAIRIFAAESVAYRAAGDVERFGDHLKGAEEYAVECSYVKVLASEVLDFVVDEGVQVHGGYGYHQDYFVERAYRDSRINRIFEGTNEINRLLATGMLLKRAKRGQLALVEGVKKLQDELMSATGPVDSDVAANAKKIALFALGLAYQRFRDQIEDQQEVLAGITECAMNAYAMESVSVRRCKLASTGKAAAAQDVCDVYLDEAMNVVEQSARSVLAASSEGDALRVNLAILRRLAKREQVNVIGARQRIASKLLESGRYLF